MLKEFKSWITKHTKYEIVSHENELSKSLVIDFENDFYIARFTVWDDLSCVSEILDVNTSQYILNNRKEFSSINELLSIFEIFSKKLKQ